MGAFFSAQESFTDDNPLRPQRPPLSGQSALQALAQAERIDQYRQRVEQSASNLRARAGQIYMPVPFSIQRAVPPANLAEPWPNGQVIWMDATADAGLPHTRAPNLICMPHTFPESSLANTLLHERIHVSQKLHPKAWQTLVEKAWNMEPWLGELPSDIQARRRINPDVMDVPLYSWKQEWVPLAIFESNTQPKLSEISMIWWQISTRTVHRDPPPGWVAFFGNVPAGEHPFEIAAYLIAANPTQNVALQALKSRLGSLPTEEV